MKKAVLLLFLMLGAASAQEAVTISVDRDLNECNLSESLINSARDLINKQWNITPYGFYNLTSSYCYDNSVSLTFLFKKEESSIKGDRVSVSLYKSEEFDYDLIFTDQENNLFSYSIKKEYIDYLVNGADNEYYVSLSGDECLDLKGFYNTLSGEKYFNQEHGYCSIVVKTRTSEVKDLVSDSVSFINYFGEEVRYSFSGHSGGSYDLASLAASIDCELSSSSHYHPELETDCYGIYKDDSRIYFSAHTQINDYRVYINVYGIMDGKARLTASAYGEDINKAAAEEWINNELSSYFPGQTLNLEGDETLSASKIVNSFEFNNNAVNDFNERKELMNTHYSGGNVSVTISEPYIQVYIPEDAVDSREVGIVPSIYWGRYFIVTSSRVYSSISLDDNNESLAVNKIKEFVDPYVTTSNWELNMTVTGNYYWPLFGLAETTNLRTMAETDAASIQAPVRIEGAVTDPLSQEHAAGFEGLDKRELTVIELIINFFKELFS
ncbi:hypothetical protein GF352_02215 [archaeon]|nr:hypothetical protein [archaeon]